MHAHLTWQPPDDDAPETLTVDLPAHLITEMRALIGTPQWAHSEAVMPIPCQTRPDGPMERRLFRLARITAVEPTTS